MLSVSQQFKEATSERIKSVFKYKREKLESTNSSLSYGYKIENKHYVVDEEKAQHIRDLFEYVDIHKSFTKALYWWNENHEHCCYNTLKTRLSNSAYIGIVERCGKVYTDMYPPILDKDLFERIQHLNDNRKMGKRSTMNDYIFSKLLVCGECGSPYVGGTSYERYVKKDGTVREYKIRYYGCRFKYERHCHNSRIKEDTLEQKVIEQLPFDLEFHFNNVIKKDKAPIKDNSKQIKTKQNRLKDLYIDGLIDKEEFEKRYKDLESKIIKAPKKKPVIDYSILSSGKYIDLYNMLDEKHKNAFWKGYIDSITITNGEINIKFM